MFLSFCLTFFESADARDLGLMTLFCFKICLLKQGAGPQMGSQYEEGGLENTIQVDVIFNSIVTTLV